MRRHSLDWARRLLRKLPTDPESLLKRQSYANPTFLPLFFEWLDDRIYHDPQAGLRWAKVAPDLALKTPAEPGPEGRQANRSRLVQAWGILGGAYRACGDHDAGDTAYSEALKIIASEAIPELVRADTDYRLSYLRACQGRAEEALELASGAVDTLRQADTVPPVQLGQGLIAKGYVLASELARYSQAVDAFGEALTLSGNGKESAAAERLHATACNNLAWALSDSGSLADQRTVLLYIRQAHRLLIGQVRSPARYRLFWLEAKVWDRLGSHAKAERLFHRALEGFEALQLPWEVALVGLDLAALLHLCGEFAELEKIARSTYQQFRLLSGADRQTLAALSLWVDAVKRRSWIADDQDDDDEKANALREYDGLHGKARHLILAGVLAGKGKGKSRRR